MIHRTVSAVLLLRDGFTGRRLNARSGVRCRLDGQDIRAVGKADGYLVLTDLPPGPHTLRLSRYPYQEEELSFTVEAGKLWEGEADLRPGRGYAVPPDAARLCLAVTEGGGPAAEAELWAGIPLPVRLSVTEAKEGERTLRLYWRGGWEALPVPGAFLLRDGEKTEFLRLLTAREEGAEAAEPLRHSHQRGCILVPLRKFSTDSGGVLEAFFPRGGTAALYCREDWRDVELQAGENPAVWEIRQQA